MVASIKGKSIDSSGAATANSSLDSTPVSSNCSAQQPKLSTSLRSACFDTLSSLPSTTPTAFDNPYSFCIDPTFDLYPVSGLDGQQTGLYVPSATTSFFHISPPNHDDLEANVYTPRLSTSYRSQPPTAFVDFEEPVSMGTQVNALLARYESQMNWEALATKTFPLHLQGLWDECRFRSTLSIPHNLGCIKDDETVYGDEDSDDDDDVEIILPPQVAGFGRHAFTKPPHNSDEVPTLYATATGIVHPDLKHPNTKVLADDSDFDVDDDDDASTLSSLSSSILTISNPPSLHPMCTPENVAVNWSALGDDDVVVLPRRARNVVPLPDVTQCQEV